MPISREDVVHVASLARLGLSDAEIDLFQSQLGGILDHMASLGRLGEAADESISSVTALTNVTRDDVVRPSLSLEEVLANAPASEDDCFRVAAVFDEA